MRARSFFSASGEITPRYVNDCITPLDYVLNRICSDPVDRRRYKMETIKVFGLESPGIQNQIISPHAFSPDHSLDQNQGIVNDAISRLLRLQSTAKG